MAITLSQLGSVVALARLPIKFLGWIKSDGTQVVANEDTPLPVSIPAGVAEAQSSSAPTNTATTPFTVLTADGNAFTLAAGNRGFIQNHNTTVLCVKLGTGASNTSFTHRLKACAVADDGTGGYINIRDWIGVVSVAAASGSPRFTAWKI